LKLPRGSSRAGSKARKSNKDDIIGAATVVDVAPAKGSDGTAPVYALSSFSSLSSN
jgi:hypothetical protein